MDWSEIAILCQTELDRFRNELPGAAAELGGNQRVASNFLAQERETREAVESAVRQFSATRRWPSLSSVQRTMLCFRLEFAAALAGLLAEQPAPWADNGEAQNDEHRISWLLLFAWEQEGFSLLHDNLDRMAGSEA